MLIEICFNLRRNVPGVFGNQQNNYLGLINQMLQQSLVDTSSSKVIIKIVNFTFTVFSKVDFLNDEMVLQVRAQAVRAVCSFIIAHEKETALQKQFQDLLPDMLRVNEPPSWF